MNMINNAKIKFGAPGWTSHYARKAVADLSNPKALAPVILLETSVLTGRCYHAKERGGWVELRERFLEETLTAAVWFFGITTLNKIGDKIAKKGLNLDTTIDVGSDKIPDEFGKLKKHMKGPLERFTDGKSTTFKNTLTRVKFAKIVLSTLTGIYVVGTIIPKFKNSVTENAKAHPEQNSIKAAMLDVFFRGKAPAKQTQNTPQNAQNNNNPLEKLQESTKNAELKFKGGLASISHKLETDNIYKMLTVDTGIVAGRAGHARNDDEKIEIVIRDVGSLYFYMASTHHVANFLANGLNLDEKMGISTKLDPRIAEELNQDIFKQFKSASMSKEEFDKFMTQIFGKENNELVKTLKEQSAKTNHTMNLDEFLNRAKYAENFEFIQANAQTAAKLNNQVITGSGVMRISRNLEELIPTKEQESNKLFKFFADESKRIYENTSKGYNANIDNNKLAEMIDKFIELATPINKEELKELRKEEIKEAIKLKEHLKQVKPDGNFVVSAQIDDIVHDGFIRDQSFLKKALSISNPDAEDPRKYVSLKSYASTKANIQEYANCLKAHMEQKLKGNGSVSRVDLERELGKFKTQTLKMKALYISAGLGVSAYFLSTAIPKFQQHVTEKRTGHKGFPGAKDLNIPKT